MDVDVVYHGYRPDGGAGTAVVVVETPEGEALGTVRHVPRHSPTGMSWGYDGSGPADCARSLLIAALGDDAARCVHCAGTARAVVDKATGEERSFDPGRADEYDPLPVVECLHCDGGYIHLPYQEFKFDIVAGLGGEWRMTRAAVLAWYGRTLGVV